MGGQRKTDREREKEREREECNKNQYPKRMKRGERRGESVGRPKPEGQKNKNQKVNYSNRMAELMTEDRINRKSKNKLMKKSGFNKQIILSSYCALFNHLVILHYFIIRSYGYVFQLYGQKFGLPVFYLFGPPDSA